MSKIEKFFYDFKMHLRNNFWVYFFIAFAIVVGIVLGLILSLSGNEYSEILNSNDNNMYDYINGNIELSGVFFERLFDVVLLMILIFLSNLTIYTSFISILLICYQSVLLVLSCSAVISLYGFTGIMNTIFLLLPINIINILLIGFFCGVCMCRALVSKRFKMTFHDSFTYVNFGKMYILTNVLLLLVCIINSFIMPLIVKSFIVVSF